MNKSLLIVGLLIAAAASQAPAILQQRQANSVNSQVLLAQRSCNPNDPSYCP